jgi:hypothetical protein
MFQLCLRPRFLGLALLGAAVVAGLFPHQTGAQDAPLRLSGFGTPTIDGRTRDEWRGAARLNFQASIPANDGGGTTSARLLVMNDAKNLYLAIKVRREGFPQGSFIADFDSDRDGVFAEEGDDVLVLSPAVGRFFDDFWTSEPPCPEGRTCGLFDTQVGGTNDGTGAAGGTGQFLVYELAHPLNSADDLHDFSLTRRHPLIGFRASIQLWSLELSCNTGLPPCVATTQVPIGGRAEIRRLFR